MSMTDHTADAPRREEDAAMSEAHLDQCIRALANIEDLAGKLADPTQGKLTPDGREFYGFCLEDMARVAREALDRPREDRIPYTIDDLPLTNQQRCRVLEYVARMFWRVLLDSDIQDGHCKSYDPLTIEGDTRGTAHSYVFDITCGGRHHDYDSLKQIEEGLLADMTRQVKEAMHPDDDYEPW